MSRRRLRPGSTLAEFAREFLEVARYQESHGQDRGLDQKPAEARDVLPRWGCRAEAGRSPAATMWPPDIGTSR
jgi:hypothetical protein